MLGPTDDGMNLDGAAEQLSLDWRGGATAKRFAQARPILDDVPWHSFDLARFSPDDPGLAEARAVWTNGVFTEYASAAAFSQLSLAMMQACLPVDLAAVAADFAVDELAHVTLVSKLVMTIGGASPYLADLANLAPTAASDDPILRVCELAIKICCVGEALSLPSLAAWHRGAGHPLMQAVLGKLRHDEGPHAAIGHWLLEYVRPSLTAGHCDYLADIAAEAISVYEPLWQGEQASTPVVSKSGMTTYAAYMEQAVEQRIVAKLARHGIYVSRTAAI